MFRHRDLWCFGGSNEIVASRTSEFRRVLAMESGNPLRVGREAGDVSEKMEIGRHVHVPAELLTFSSAVVCFHGVCMVFPSDST